MSSRDERRFIGDVAQALQDVKRATMGRKIEAECLATLFVVRGDGGQLAALVVTSDSLFWRVVKPGAPVFSMMFRDVVRVMGNDYGGVLITYVPSDMDPDVEAAFRKVNPSGELDAEFIFGTEGAARELRQQLVDRASVGMENNVLGEVLAVGNGYLEGIAVDVERYAVTVEARGSVIVVSGPEFERCGFPYAAASWFLVGPQRAESFATQTLGLSPDDETVCLSLADEGIDGRWLLIVKPDDIMRWRVLLEHSSIRDAAL